jgi:TonB family protein
VDSIGTHGEAAEIQSGPAHYVWKIPGVAVHIRISLEVVRRIREYLTAHSVRYPDSEAGGLLIGKSHAPGVEIDDFAPIVLDSQSGSHFIIPETQTPSLRKQIEEVNRLGEGLPVIGYFRSDVREGICLSPEDLSLIREFFPDRSNVFLVVRSDKTTHPTAGFFFWEGDCIFAACSFMEFDFDEKKLASPSYAAAEVATVPNAGDQAPQQPVSSSDQTTQAHLGLPTYEPAASYVRNQAGKDAPQWRRWFLGAGIAAGFGLLGAYFLISRPIGSSLTASEPIPARTTIRAPESVGLMVSRSGADIGIVWNGQAPLITGARVAVLTIDDGGFRRDVPLTPDQLRSSRLVYTPQTDTVEVALEIFANDGRVTRENVIAVANAGTSAPTATRARPLQMEIQVEKSAAEPRDPSESQERHGGAIREFVPPAVRVEPIAPLAEAPIPPALAVRMDAPRMDPPVVERPVQTIPAPVPLEAPHSLSVKPSEQIQVLSQPPVQPAVPVRQVKPVLPRNVKAMLTSRANVKVRIQVDATGKVTGAEAVAPIGSLERFLGAAAASAARMWTFEPAMAGQRKVPSELTLEFTFVRWTDGQGN